jgi:hypothetical protein
VLYHPDSYRGSYFRMIFYRRTYFIFSVHSFALGFVPNG